MKRNTTLILATAFATALGARAQRSRTWDM